MVSFWLWNAAHARENFPLPFHLDVKRNGPNAREKRNGTGARTSSLRSKRNGTGLRTSSLRSKRNDEKVSAAWVCSVSFVPGFFRSEFFPRLRCGTWLGWISHLGRAKSKGRSASSTDRDSGQNPGWGGPKNRGNISQKQGNSLSKALYLRDSEKNENSAIIRHKILVFLVLVSAKITGFR